MKLLKLMLVFFGMFLLVGCESEPPNVESVSTPDPITIRQFETPDQTLEETLEVELDDGSSLNVSIAWNNTLQSFDTTEIGTFEIVGDLEDGAFSNPDSIKAVQTIEIEPASIEEGLDYSQASHFKTMYEAFEHPDKASLKTLFVPSDAAIQEILDFLEMNLESLIDHDAFDDLMLDHMSMETISKNRLETNVPGVYQTLRDKDLIVEGSVGSPLIDSEHTLLNTHDLVTRHVHYIDGMILFEDTLGTVGSNVFDDEMQTRLLGILRDEGFVQDLLLGRKFTIFIPSETALFDYAQNKGLSLNSFLESSEFENIILSHIVRAEYSIDELYIDTPQLESVSGESINVTVEANTLYANGVLISETETVDQVGTLLTIDEILEFDSE